MSTFTTSFKTYPWTPEEAAEKRMASNIARGELAKVDIWQAEQIKLTPSKKTSIQSKASGMRKEWRAAIAELEIDLKDCPPTPISPDEAVARIDERLNEVIEAYFRAQDEYIEKMQNDPMYYIANSSDDVVKAQRKMQRIVELAGRIDYHVNEGLELLDAYDAGFKDIREEVQRNVMREMRSGFNSSSKIHNLVDEWKIQADIELIENKFGYMGAVSEWMQERIAVWQAMQK